MSLPVLFLDELYQQVGDKTMQERKNKTLIILNSQGMKAVLAVDEVIETRNIVDKPLPGVLQDTYQQHTGISGYSLLGDGPVSYTHLFTQSDLCPNLFKKGDATGCVCISTPRKMCIRDSRDPTT